MEPIGGKMNLNNILIQASRHGHIEIVEQCLKHGADAHARNNEALFLAAGNGHAETLELLTNWSKK